jgi:hypothetical protein
MIMSTSLIDSNNLDSNFGDYLKQNLYLGMEWEHLYREEHAWLQMVNERSAGLWVVAVHR